MNEIKKRMSKLSFILGLCCFMLFACGGKKEVVKKKTEDTEVFINPSNDVAIAGAANFDDEESLSIYSAILKNVTGEKSGAYIGHQMDRLANYFENNLESTELLRVGEGVIIEFDSNTNFTFYTGKSSLNFSTKEALEIIAKALEENPKINVIIETHTDSSGDDDINLKLSQERVMSIKNYLVEQDIDINRIKTKAFGETQPKVDNTTAENRRMNRRVEFGFYASELLKAEAQEKTK